MTTNPSRYRFAKSSGTGSISWFNCVKGPFENANGRHCAKILNWYTTPVCGGKGLQRTPMPLGLTAVHTTDPSVAVVATWVRFPGVGKTGLRFDAKGFDAPVVPKVVTTHRFPKASWTWRRGLFGEVATPTGVDIFCSGCGFGPTEPACPAPIFTAPQVA